MSSSRFINKYHTPRVYQILGTLLTLLQLFFLDGFSFLSFLSAATCIVFLWINRPKWVLLAYAGYVLLVLLDILFTNILFTNFSAEIFLYILTWIISALPLAVFFILVILFTKNGPRHLAKDTVPVMHVSKAAEIQKYKELLDSGVITQADYQEKKSQLLNL